MGKKHRRGMFGETTASKRIVHRDSIGRFKRATIGGMCCHNTECNAIIIKERKPQVKNGFVDPFSMVPRFPEECPRCGTPTNKDNQS